MPAHVMTAAELRDWAAKCERAAKDPRVSGDERDRLLKMKSALLDVAKTQEWLEGKLADRSSDAT